MTAFPKRGKYGAHPSSETPYAIEIDTKRAEVLRKNGITLNPDFDRSVALMLHGSYHNADNQYGSTLYGVRQWNGYAQLMFETDFSPAHNFSADGQVNWDKV